MKTLIVMTALFLACGSAFAQEADANAGSQSASGSTSVLNGGNLNSTNAQGQKQQQGQTNQNGQEVMLNQTSNANDQLKTVGSPGAVSYGVAFSQFNCANTAAIGGGWLGGVFQLGGPLESGPCNARANAAALFQLSQSLESTDPVRSSQLFNAAILLLGNSTSATQEALQTAGVKEWSKSPEPQSSANGIPPPTLTQLCPGNYCGSDPIVKQRMASR